MKVIAQALLLSAVLMPAMGLVIPSVDNEKRTYKSGDVKQVANSGNNVWSSNNGGKATNGKTSVKGGLLGVAVPVAKADGGDTIVYSGDAENYNKKSGKGNVGQLANSGNNVVSSNNGGKATNGDTTVKSGFFGSGIAAPIAKAGGGGTYVSSGDAYNTNEKRTDSHRKSGDVFQGANSGNNVWSSNNGGKATNGNTNAKGLVGVAAPIAIADGGDTGVISGDAINSNKQKGVSHKSSGSVKQGANSGNNVVSSGNGGKATNGNTSSGGALIGVAVPIAVADGGDTEVESGDAYNENKSKSGSRKSSGSVKQGANSGNNVVSNNNGGKATNGNTNSQGGLIGVAVPIAVAGGGDTFVGSGDAVNSNVRKN